MYKQSQTQVGFGTFAGPHFAGKWLTGCWDAVGTRSGLSTAVTRTIRTALKTPK